MGKVFFKKPTNKIDHDNIFFSFYKMTILILRKRKNEEINKEMKVE